MSEADGLLSRDADVAIRKVVLRRSLAHRQDACRSGCLRAAGVDSLMKGQLDRNLPAASRKLSDQQVGWIDKATADGVLAEALQHGPLHQRRVEQPGDGRHRRRA